MQLLLIVLKILCFCSALKTASGMRAYGCRILENGCLIYKIINKIN